MVIISLLPHCVANCNGDVVGSEDVAGDGNIVSYLCLINNIRKKVNNEKKNGMSEQEKEREKRKEKKKKKKGGIKREKHERKRRR